ncbi:MAG: hypothetical protein JXR46_01420 [Calditrichaceae bacterium]|nr:hypothetical protein [Calditrichaceae bacterium]MBN2707677.1 hypothetical protein [Calditrichaceae bacterium]RQV97791.1 MAG: hypothetical protein EH224_00220 [Calditrichota bacterium]
MTLNDDDYREIFSLFSSVTDYELKQIYDKNSSTYYKGEILNEEYELVGTKLEFAKDSFRAILYYLHKHGYELYKNKNHFSIKFIEKEFGEMK